MITIVYASYPIDYSIVPLRKWKQSNFTYNMVLCNRENIIVARGGACQSIYSGDKIMHSAQYLD